VAILSPPAFAARLAYAFMKGPATNFPAGPVNAPVAKMARLTV
jgi:hypothetical protein